MSDIYKIEPNFDNYDYHTQCLIKGIYGFRDCLKMAMDDEDVLFIMYYCETRNVEMPEIFKGWTMF